MGADLEFCVWRHGTVFAVFPPFQKTEGAKMNPFATADVLATNRQVGATQAQGTGNRSVASLREVGSRL
jgi:hypothetical protein